MVIEEPLRLFVPSDEWVTEGGYIRIIEKLIKQGGETWIFHKNDPDPFPSRPHGHNKETGEKLDINTGIIYSVNKKSVRKLSKKQLRYITNSLTRNKFI